MRSKIFTRTVGYWPLQEASGNALDYSGREHHGSLSVGVTQDVSGPLGESAYEFDGQDGRVYSSAPNWNGSHTVSIWLKTDNIQNSYFSTTDDYTVSNSLQLYYNGSNLVLNEVSNTRLRWNNVNGAGWVNIVWKVGPNGAKAYRNGELLDTSSNLTSGQFNAYKICENRNGGSYGRGKLAHVRVWDYPLPEASIKALYNASRGGFSQSDVRGL
ncbi:LamG-like jellyroll fold domain-containing protein [Candidatus Nanosalina sp. VS9-1]|uniref:LamG-like jellyroll fold domain-containing protein n=1 Tax=Candidatus Nanosalina sp. VS9-1 TaxID=3388566 RepID=UPI0039E140D4